MHFSAFIKHIKPKYFLSCHRSRLWRLLGIREQLEKQLRTVSDFSFPMDQCCWLPPTSSSILKGWDRWERKMFASAIHTVLSSEQPRSVGNWNKRGLCLLLVPKCCFAVLTDDRLLPAYRPLPATVAANITALKHSSSWEKSLHQNLVDLLSVNIHSRACSLPIPKPPCCYFF